MRTLTACLILALWGCGGSDRGSEVYWHGTWTQGGQTARIRFMDIGDHLEGWTDDGRRVSGNWPRLVLNEAVWVRGEPGIYRQGTIVARMEVRR